MTRAVDAAQVARSLANAPGYLVKVPCTHAQFMQIGSAVHKWDGDRHVRVCVYMGLDEPVAVVSLRPSATESTIAALQALLARWGESTVAAVTDPGADRVKA